jgi:hypothetical protein
MRPQDQGTAGRPARNLLFILRRSLARVLRRRGMEDARPRNLGGDQEGREDRRNADKSQELIH